MSTLPLVIAHRGASHLAPENTLPAFQLAWREGADGIEADFRKTRDGALVCIHDPGTARTAGRNLSVKDTSLDELRRLDVGGWKGSQWRGTGLPTLEEVLKELPPGKRLYLELKGGVEMLDGLEAVLARTETDPALLRILSFDAWVVTEAVRRLPHHRACWLTGYRQSLAGRRPTVEEILTTLCRSGSCGLGSAAMPRMNHHLAAALREAGMEIHVWTVDDPQLGRYYRQLGVDSIITNYPGEMGRALAEDG